MKNLRDKIDTATGEVGLGEYVMVLSAAMVDAQRKLDLEVVSTTSRVKQLFFATLESTD